MHRLRGSPRTRKPCVGSRERIPATVWLNGVGIAPPLVTSQTQRIPLGLRFVRANGDTRPWAHPVAHALLAD